MNSGNLINHLEVWGIEEGITVFRDGSFGFGFELAPIDISCFADDKVNQIKQAIRALFDGLPKQIDTQFVQLVDRGASEDILDHQKLSENASDLVKNLTVERIKRFSELNEQGVLPKQSNFFLVRVPPPRDLLPKRRLLKMFRAEDDVMQMHEQDFSVALKRIQILKNDIESIVLASGFKAHVVESEKLVSLLFDCWNPDHSIGIGKYDESDIRDKILCSEVVKDVKGFRLGTTFHRVVTLKTLPEQTYSGMASALVAMPFSSRLYLSVYVPDQEKEIEWLKLNRRMAYSMVTGKKGVSDVESEAKLQDLETLLNQVVQEGEKIFHASLTVVLRSSNEELVDAQVGRRVFKKLMRVLIFFPRPHCQTLDAKIDQDALKHRILLTLFRSTDYGRGLIAPPYCCEQELAHSSNLIRFRQSSQMQIKLFLVEAGVVSRF
jgi:anti-sigma28 factor (negative regulator of flagellin synthesis)